MEKKDYIYSKLDEIRAVINRLEKMIPDDFITLDLNAQKHLRKYWQKQLRRISDDSLPQRPIQVTRGISVGFTPGSPGWTPTSPGNQGRSPTNLTPSSPAY